MTVQASLYQTCLETTLLVFPRGDSNNVDVIYFVSDKGCVRHCVENMQRAQDLSPLDLVEMFVTVFCFLKDSSEVSQTLLDDFRACLGYNYLTEFILR